MIWADVGYRGHPVDWAAKPLGSTVAIVRKLTGQGGSQGPAPHAGRGTAGNQGVRSV
jgi:hypothetical protein